MSILIPLSRIIDNKWQTRQSYDEAYVEDLAADIERNGLLQVPVARLSGVPGKAAAGELQSQVVMGSTLERHPDACIELAFGHTRRRAFQLLEKQRRLPENYMLAPNADTRSGAHPAMPCELRHLSDERMATLAWTENEKRKDLTPVEEALAIERRMEDFGWTQQQAAEHLGVGRSTVANKLRLLKLPERVLKHVRSGAFSERQALAMLPAVTLAGEDRDLIPGSSRLNPGNIITMGRNGEPSAAIRHKTKKLMDLIEDERRKREERAPRLVFLLACSASKSEASGPAEEVYEGQLFRKQLTYAKRYLRGFVNGRDPDGLADDEVRGKDLDYNILSAKYGLLVPDTCIAPYDQSIADLDEEEREAWSNRVAQSLRREGYHLFYEEQFGEEPTMDASPEKTSDGEEISSDAEAASRKTDSDAPSRQEAFNQPELSSLERAVLRKAGGFPPGGNRKEEFEEDLSKKERGAVGRLMQLGYLRTAGAGWLKRASEAEKVLENAN